MSTLGQKPATQHVSTEKQTITGNGGTSYTLQQSVSQASDIEVFVNNTRQEPTVAYTASGTTLTMTGAVNSSDSFYVIFQGKAIQTAVLPVDAAITASTISSSGNTTVGGTLGVTGATTLAGATLSGDLTIADKIIHSGDTDTEIRFSSDNEVKVFTGGVENIKFSSNSVVVNNGGENVDFRIEGDGDDGLLFADAGADQVCLGTTTTISNTKLNVAGPIKGTFAGGAAPSTGTMNQFVDGGNNTYNTLFRNTASTPNSQYIVEIKFQNASPDNSNAKFLECRDGTTNRFYINSDGDVRNHDNSYGAISDIKLKEQISDATSQWDDIKALKVRKFKFKTDVATGDTDAHWRLGVIAQELETAGMNKLITEDDDIEEKDGVVTSLGTKTKTVKYSVLYMKAIKALQESMARIETLEAKVTALESK